MLPLPSWAHMSGWGHLGSQAHGPASKAVSPSGCKIQSAALRLPCQKHPVPERRPLVQEHLLAIPACLPGAPVTERRTLQSTRNIMHPSSASQPFKLRVHRENLLQLCRSLQQVKGSAPLCPHCPGSLREGRRAQSPRYLHTGSTALHGPPQPQSTPCPAPCSEPSLRSSTHVLFYTLLNLPANKQSTLRL